MIVLTTSIAVPNIARWECIAFELGKGSVTLRFYFGGVVLGRFVDIAGVLSDVVNSSSGARINPTPAAADDTVVRWNVGPTGSGVGAASSLTNARDAYRGGANHNAGLRAVELRGLTDGWVDPALGGT
jgi:hypothetical protein